LCYILIKTEEYRILKNDQNGNIENAEMLGSVEVYSPLNPFSQKHGTKMS
jgi:hypothetical protein